jgi:hypothetical protein
MFNCANFFSKFKISSLKKLLLGSLFILWLLFDFKEDCVKLFEFNFFLWRNLLFFKLFFIFGVFDLSNEFEEYFELFKMLFFLLDLDKLFLLIFLLKSLFFILFNVNELSIWL